MRFKSIVAGAAIAAAAVAASVGTGPAHSADGFAMLERVQAVGMTQSEMRGIRGASYFILRDFDGDGVLDLIQFSLLSAKDGPCPQAGCIVGLELVDTIEFESGVDCGLGGARCFVAGVPHQPLGSP